jgi:uncharacterized protein YndB with AHSA1/START domain
MSKRNEEGAEVLITRIINAPRELVFKAWIDPAHLMNWFAPRGCTIEFVSIDPRPGGIFHHCIRNPRLHDCWCIGTYQKIVTPELIVYSLAIANEKGERISPADAGMDPGWPAETIVTVTFKEINGKTQVTLHQTVAESLAKRTGAYPSWLEMLDRLEEYLGVYTPQIHFENK